MALWTLNCPGIILLIHVRLWRLIILVKRADYIANDRQSIEFSAPTSVQAKLKDTPPLNSDKPLGTASSERVATIEFKVLTNVVQVSPEGVEKNGVTLYKLVRHDVL